ncbi:hypothetical protein N7493_009344 [Penicillium malachiteum]|uniref:Uncharacterized protein n=1 Tax=Penicillium malachiteum TaxID=1324776 RepID=A0AAD6HF19_9EURO|nr:hypothetical protein N7493_009344 [Penicillium malachiteum]
MAGPQSTGPALVPSGLPFHQRSFLLFLSPSPPFRQLADHRHRSTRGPESVVSTPPPGPALPGPPMGRCKTNKSSQGRADAQRLAATRLLDRVHDPLGHFSRLQRIIPARGDIAIRQPAPEGFSPGAVASLLRCVARRPIRIQLRRAGQNRRVPARILT